MDRHEIASFFRDVVGWIVEPTPWRVAVVSDKGNWKYQVTATENHVEKFTYVDTARIVPP